MSQKLKAGILGATGIVGQRFVCLLSKHPWFELTCIAASPFSANRPYEAAVQRRWALCEEIPHRIAGQTMLDASDVERISKAVDFVFSAVDMPQEATATLEEAYARQETPVVSCTAAHRWTTDVPMLIPEVNADQTVVIEAQRRRLKTVRGFIAVKPNCSIQSYVLAMQPLRHFQPVRMAICTLQAVSGAGKTLHNWPEIADNVIPFIQGEEEKSENEPLKIWGNVSNGHIIPAAAPVITAQCTRVPVSDGHMAAVFVGFKKKLTREDILSAWREYTGGPQMSLLPSATPQLLRYLEDDNRPQTRLDRDAGNGQTITLGRLRPDAVFDWRFIALSHNTLRGAAAGALLTAELLKAQGYLTAK